MRQASTDSLVSPFDAEACIDELAEARSSGLPSLLGEGGGLFLLIDPMAGDPMLAEPLPAGLETDGLNLARSQTWARPCFALMLPPAMELDAALAPYLVELQGAQDPLLAVAVQWAVQEAVMTWVGHAENPMPHCVGGILRSTAFGPELATKLSLWLCLSTRASTSARYLRLADRRVWSLTLHVLGESAVAERLAPMQHWYWLDPNAAWRCLSAAPAQAGAKMDAAQGDKAPAALGPFSIAQWAQMKHGEAVHRRMAQALGQRAQAATSAAELTQWPPVSAAQWHAAIQDASTSAA